MAQRSKMQASKTIPRAKGHVAAAATQAAIDELTPLLTAFLANPFDGGAIRGWYLALAAHCPLWALQERAYMPLAKSDRNKLVLDHAWQLMAAASANDAVRVERHARPIIDARLQGSRWVSTIDGPMLAANAPPAGEYLVQAYRDLLLRRVKEIPLTDALPKDHLRIPVREKSRPTIDPDDSSVGHQEAYAALDVVTELRGLVVARDLAAATARSEAEEDLTSCLRELGVLGNPKGGRPSLPSTRKLIAALARECAIWLPTEGLCCLTQLSSVARASLRDWRCGVQPEEWAARLAFPFLAPREFAYVRSVRGEGKRERDRDRVTAVYLIQRRIAPFCTLKTAADYALGTWEKERHSDDWERNPLQP
jgi:hypothetical protein